jgi:U3 small nucleolar RNA-associated protein 20
VALTIAKVIRRLPVDQFKLHLHKLINLIVVKGLRERDLNTRDKARKALLQVVDEVSPRFITTIVSEMQSNLDRGFQLHVYLYTVHVVLQHIKES